jgi:hypothetical protein
MVFRCQSVAEGEAPLDRSEERTGAIMAEFLSEQGLRLVLLCVLPLAVIVICLAITGKVWQQRRRLRESEARDAVRVAERLFELTAQAVVVKEETEHRREEGYTKGRDIHAG